jgi:alanyl-tRNA synthetase
LQEHRAIPIAEAQEKGAMMLFGEKYGEVVRMIQFGDSKELCGGIHVPSTKEIKLFKIKSEGSVAAGIRRIEALTNFNAEDFIKAKIRNLEEIAYVLKNVKGADAIIEDVVILRQKIQKELNETYSTSPQEHKYTDDQALTLSLSHIDLLKEEGRKIKDQLTQLKKELLKVSEEGSKEQAKAIKEELHNKLQVINGVNVIAQKINLNDSAAIKDLVFQLKGEINNLYLVLGAEVNGKPNLTIALSDNLQKDKNLHAGNIIREAAKEMQGGGGGQPFYATAGGNNVAGLDAAIAKALSFLN